MKNESKCRAGGRIRIQGTRPRILQICHSNGCIRIDKSEIVPGGIQVEGALAVSILYISSDDTMPFAVLEGMVPFSHMAEIPDIDPGCRFSLLSSLEQLSSAMADSEEIEVKAVVGLNFFVVRPRKQRCIQGISEQEYGLETLEAAPGITGYIVGEEETLWDIAKQYYMTPQQIAEMNGLDTEKIKKGDCLILMKSVDPLRHFS